MKQVTGKIIGIGGVNAIMLLSGSTIALGVGLLASILIILSKEKTPRERLIEEIQDSFKYNYKEAEGYADKLKNMALNEYKKGFEEKVIDKE